MAKYNYITRAKMESVKEELNEMRTRGRAEIAKQIAEARDKGDLSENAEYDAAKDAQGLHELKISKLENLIANARIIEQSQLSGDVVSILSKVKIKNTKNGAVLTYTFVAEEEADLKSGKLSIKSPIGSGLMGKKVGEKAVINVPAGKMEFEVVEIEAGEL